MTEKNEPFISNLSAEEFNTVLEKIKKNIFFVRTGTAEELDETVMEKGEIAVETNIDGKPVAWRVGDGDKLGGWPI